MNNAASPAQLIIAAMITPALLILGSGSLVATALVRLARAVDRARALLSLSESEIGKLGLSEGRWKAALERYANRAMQAERAVTAFFIGVGIFVLACLSIALDHYYANALTWLPVSLTIAGMFTMLAGALFMVLESRLASLQIREEIERMTLRK